MLLLALVAVLAVRHLSDRSLQSFLYLHGGHHEDDDGRSASQILRTRSAAIPPPQYIINLTRTRAQQFQSKNSTTTTPTDAIDQVKILAVNHPAFRNISTSLQPLSSWRNNHFPYVNIAGLQKGGSSQLYNILITHSHMTKFHYEKEFAFGITHLSIDVSNLLLQPRKTKGGHPMTLKEQMGAIQKFFFYRTKNAKFVSPKKLPKVTPAAVAANTTNNKQQHQISPAPPIPLKTVNACLDSVTVMMMRQYLQRNHNSKIIFMVRDPADWLWASWNFWTFRQHNDLIEPLQKDWAASPEQYRSPELFHEMLLAGNYRFGPTAELMARMRDRICNLFTRVMAAAYREDPSNILVVKSEDMAPDRIEASGFLKTLANFLQVPLDGFDASVFQSFSNCGNNRGIGAKCSQASSAYAIAGNQTMLEKSRDLVYLYFAEECRLWAEEFGVVYDRCLQVSKEHHIHSYFPSS